MHFCIPLATSGEQELCIFTLVLPLLVSRLGACLPIAYCLLATACCHGPLQEQQKKRVFLEWPLGPLQEQREKGVGPIALCMLLIAYCIVPIAFCLVHIAYLLAFSYVSSPSPVRPQSVFRAYCLLPIAYIILCYVIWYSIISYYNMFLIFYISGQHLDAALAFGGYRRDAFLCNFRIAGNSISDSNVYMYIQMCPSPCMRPRSL